MMSELKASVAEHYNNLPQYGNEERRNSPIYYLRSFNNWVKSVSIGEALDLIRKDRPDARLHALDLCCGKGGDLKKWKIGRLDRVVFADLAEVSINQAKERYQEMVAQQRYGRLFRAEFIVADCAGVDLSDKYQDPGQQFDLVSCQFSFHYSFETYERAERILKNACDRLVPGGIFLATIPDSHEIMRRLKEADDLKFGNSIYSVTFDTAEQQPLFGAKYHFYLQDHVDLPEFLVFFPTLMEMAGKLGMTLLYRSTFNEFFDQHSRNPRHFGLLERMNALETYPADELVGSVDQDHYAYAQDIIDNKLAQDNYRSPRVGTMSKPEWDVVSMYSVFAFQKQPTPETAQSQNNPATGAVRPGDRGGYRDGSRDSSRRDTSTQQTSLSSSRDVKRSRKD